MKINHLKLNFSANHDFFSSVELNQSSRKEPIIFVTHNGWRYEKLPIAGDFLSSYTKVEAGYNP